MFMLLTMYTKEELKEFVNSKKKNFVPGESSVPVSGKVFDENELSNMMEAVMDCHRTEWRWNEKFEKWLSEFLWVKFVATTNSGSSANLLALSTLTSKELWERQLLPWDEVITVAAWFPTTITPIIQNRLVPVFVDVDLWTYEVNIEALKQAISPKTKCIMLAHTLWNAFNLWEITKVCKEHNLWLIEDTCDALWTTYNGQYIWTFGDIWTLSFYPAHHITTWEWWALITNNPLLYKLIKQFRDWWRDCWCKTGQDNSCWMRFKWQLWELPEWFDHKYIYSKIGYNLKMTDMQASIWCAQLEKLPNFIQKRKNNAKYLSDKFVEHWLDQYFILPKATENSEPSRFGFCLSLKEGSWINREDLLQYLNNYKIWTRLLFAWNFTRQPAFLDYVKDYRIVWELKNTDYVVDNTFRLWTFPELTDEMLDFVVLKIVDFINGRE